jgi:glyoxylase-like metal-dependent hydrolase (beta-lactamase superfamily II)
MTPERVSQSALRAFIERALESVGLPASDASACAELMARADGLPGVTIVAHPETSRLMLGYLTYFLPRNLDLPARIQRMITDGKDEGGRTLTEDDLATFRSNLPNYEKRAEEFKSVVIRLPELTFERELELDLGNRTVRLLHLGRGNTSGDIVVHLPKERIMVAGDLLVYPSPYTIGGFPREWSRTLEAVAALAAETIVPGHGAVLSGETATSYLSRVRDLLATFATVVQDETFRVGNDSIHLEEVKAAVAKHPDIAAQRARWVAADPELGAWFDSALPNLVTSAYREVWGN